MRVLLSLVLLATVACQSSLVDGNGSGPSTPANLSYELEPSGDPNRPLGILLLWDDVTDANLASYRVYSRASTSGSFDARRNHLQHIPRQRRPPSAVPGDCRGRQRGGERWQQRDHGGRAVAAPGARLAVVDFLERRHSPRVG